MLKLKPPFSEQVYQVFKPLRHNLAVLSIFKGFTESIVYADSESPTWGVTYTNSRIFASGDFMHPDVLKAVQKVVDYGLIAGRAGFVIYYPRSAGRSGIGENIKGVKTYPKTRNYYLLEPREKYVLSLPEDYRVERISHDLLKMGYVNSDLVQAEMQSERDSVDDFLDKSFGFCVVKDDEISSWCMSEYNVADRFEIGIETHPAHRRKGLAVQAARACINHGLDGEYTSVGWHCWKDNEASNRTASSLGFRHMFEYPIEYLKTN